MTVDNQVDQSTAAGCAKANAYRPKGGLIALYSQTTDSVVEGNEQQEGDGILLAHQLTPVTTGQYQSIFQYFTEVRGNTIDGEYRYSSDCSMSGINLGYGTTPDIPPPVAGFGETISHNFVTAADGLRGGAIGITRGWFAGPPPNNWKFIDGAVVFHNVIKDITLPIATVDGCDGSATKRSGIHFQDELVWRTTLYGNSCTNVSTKLDDGGQDTRSSARRRCSAIRVSARDPLNRRATEVDSESSGPPARPVRRAGESGAWLTEPAARSGTRGGCSRSQSQRTGPS